jgi:uncharacterized protein YegP (UPF0339 family)
MSEFSRRVDVRIIKDEPHTFEEFLSDKYGGEDFVDLDQYKGEYQEYLTKFQPFRFHAKAGNFEIMSHGENYLHEADCIHAVEVLFGDDTTMWYAREYGEDRGDKWLRYGKTDRDAQVDDSPEQAGE